MRHRSRRVTGTSGRPVRDRGRGRRRRLVVRTAQLVAVAVVVVVATAVLPEPATGRGRRRRGRRIHVVRWFGPAAFVGRRATVVPLQRVRRHRHGRFAVIPAIHFDLLVLVERVARGRGADHVSGRAIRRVPGRAAFSTNGQPTQEYEA